MFIPEYDDWPSTALVSRRAFERVGGFDEELSGYEDDDLWLRIFCAGFGNEYISEPLTRIRQHSGQSHRNRFDELVSNALCQKAVSTLSGRSSSWDPALKAYHCSFS